MKALIIPEDPRLDQYILKPIVEEMFRRLDIRARVSVLQDPRLRGIDEALDADVIREIVRDNPMEDLFLLLVDRDCDRKGNTDRAAAREGEHPDRLIACLATHEVEVWMLALHRAELGTPWTQVRQHCDPKEAYADPFLERQGWTGEVGQGRKKAMRDLGGHWNGLLQVCDELAHLQERVAAWVSLHAGGTRPTDGSD
ncbi:MAG: hypothetical protein HY815_07890 [Candidatus Riflebacteria bacterium]|nr:hypothetical protein [Candidatus Riflebacteria bacterium]